MDQAYDTYDIDFQHHLNTAGGHQLVWGLGYRGVRAETRATPTGTVSFTDMTSHLWSGFLQGDFELPVERARLVLGSKFEHNDLTGFEYQPNVRLLWKLSEQQVLWAAISRAVRTPSLGEQFVSLQSSTVPPTPPLLPQPAVVVAKGTTDFQTEHLLAYEIGIRINTAPDWSLDAALFLNDYEDLRTVESRLPIPSGVGPFLLIESPFANLGEGQVYGLEVAVDWLPRDDWRLALAYTWSRMSLQTAAGSLDTTIEAAEDNLPRQQLSLRSLASLRPDVDFDLWLRYVGESAGFDPDTFLATAVPAYWDLDLRLAWRPDKAVELALVGQNLLDASRVEGRQEFYSSGDREVRRGVYASVRVDF